MPIVRLDAASAREAVLAGFGMMPKARAPAGAKSWDSSDASAETVGETRAFSAADPANLALYSHFCLNRPNNKRSTRTETMDTFFRRISLLVLTVVDFYGNATESWHPLLAIGVPVGIFASIKYLAPSWLFLSLSVVMVAFSAAFFVTVAYVCATYLAFRRD